MVPPLDDRAILATAGIFLKTRMRATKSTTLTVPTREHAEHAVRGNTENS
jgi:hypothetical protein